MDLKKTSGSPTPSQNFQGGSTTERQTVQRTQVGDDIFVSDGAGIRQTLADLGRRTDQKDPDFVRHIREAVLASKEVQEAIARDPQASVKLAAKRFRKMEARQWPAAQRFLLPELSRRSEKAGPGKKDLDVKSFEKVARFRDANPEKPVIFLPTHRSNLDSLLLIETLMKSGITENYYWAGDNLASNPLLAKVMNWFGAMFLPRSFDENTVEGRLDKVLSTKMVEEIMRQGKTWTVFPEGTRSRQGPIEPFRAGVLKRVMEFVRDGKFEDVMLVPVSIDYPQGVPGAKKLRKRAKGERPSNESLLSLSQSTFDNRAKGDGTSARVRCGEMVSLKALLEEAKRLAMTPDEKAQRRVLSDRLELTAQEATAFAASFPPDFALGRLELGKHAPTGTESLLDTSANTSEFRTTGIVTAMLHEKIELRAPVQAMGLFAAAVVKEVSQNTRTELTRLVDALRVFVPLDETPIVPQTGDAEPIRLVREIRSRLASTLETQSPLEFIETARALLRTFIHATDDRVDLKLILQQAYDASGTALADPVLDKTRRAAIHVELRSRTRTLEDQSVAPECANVAAIVKDGIANEWLRRHSKIANAFTIDGVKSPQLLAFYARQGFRAEELSNVREDWKIRREKFDPDAIQADRAVVV